MPCSRTIVYYLPQWDRAWLAVHFHVNEITWLSRRPSYPLKRLRPPFNKNRLKTSFRRGSELFTERSLSPSRTLSQMARSVFRLEMRSRWVVIDGDVGGSSKVIAFQLVYTAFIYKGGLQVIPTVEYSGSKAVQSNAVLLHVPLMISCLQDLLLSSEHRAVPILSNCQFFWPWQLIGFREDVFPDLALGQVVVVAQLRTY